MAKTKLRVIMAVLGIFLCGIGVAMLKVSMFGTDPYQCLVTGLDIIIPISYGTLYVVMNAITIVFVFLINKKYIGIATIINLFLLGYIIDFVQYMLIYMISEINFAVRVILLLCGFLIICFSMAIYFTADLGVSTYDAVALIMADKKIAKFKYCRIATDIICTSAGFVLGAPVGVGTVMTAFLTGPITSWMKKRLTDPFLAKIGVE